MVVPRLEVEFEFRIFFFFFEVVVARRFCG